jgi:maltose alpha-D-glucosyltransferase / alpha-amylase
VQWINFLRHHDELSLVDLSQSQREEIAAAFAPEEEMWVYDRGVRRRLAPMLQGDRRRIELAYSLCFSLPGTPLIQYGAEIGMGEDLTLPQREAIRTSMQWADAHNAGFSPADPSALPRPVIADGPFSYRHCNVATQQRESGSLLNWIERLIRVRRQCPEMGCGDWKILETGNRQVLAHRFDTREATLVAVHHLGSQQPCQVALEDLVPEQGMLAEVLSDQFYDPPSGDPPQITLEPFGYRWFRISMKMRSA